MASDRGRRSEFAQERQSRHVFAPGFAAVQPLKRAKTIKTYSQLPRWFSLINYGESKNLSAVGWYEQLLTRQSCLYYVNQGLVREPIKILLNSIRKNPILDLSNYPRILYYVGGGKLAALKSSSPTDAATLRGVHVITVRELFWTERHMREGRRLYAAKFAEQVFERDISDNESFVFK